jgi:hypothetical protein
MTEDDAGTDGRWLTYDEIAKLRGIKRIGAVRLVQRYKWRRMEGNDGKARVLVPVTALEPVRRTDAGNQDDNISLNDRGTGAGTNALSMLQAAFQTTLQAKDEVIAAQGSVISELRISLDEARATAQSAEAAALKAEHDKASATMVAEELAKQAAEWKSLTRWGRLRAAWKGD